MTWIRLRLVLLGTVCAVVYVLGGIVGPAIAFACEGAGEENIGFEEVGKAEKRDFTFKGKVPEEMPFKIWNQNPFGEEVKIISISLGGKEPKGFELVEQINCVEKTLEKEDSKCEFKIRLDEEAAKEAEVKITSKSLGRLKKEQTLAAKLLH